MICSELCAATVLTLLYYLSCMKLFIKQSKKNQQNVIAYFKENIGAVKDRLSTSRTLLLDGELFKRISLKATIFYSG